MSTERDSPDPSGTGPLPQGQQRAEVSYTAHGPKYVVTGPNAVTEVRNRIPKLIVASPIYTAPATFVAAGIHSPQLAAVSLIVDGVAFVVLRWLSKP